MRGAILNLLAAVAVVAFPGPPWNAEEPATPKEPAPDFVRPLSYNQPREQSPGEELPDLRVPMASANIKISSNDFSPKTMIVFPRTTVRWTNMDRHKHTITSETGLFHSGELGQDKTFSYTFMFPGTYHYFCAFEPKKSRGTIIVR